MNHEELIELSKLLNKALYELEEFGKPVTEDLYSKIYSLIRKIALTILDNTECEGRDDRMDRLNIVVQILHQVCVGVNEKELVEELENSAKHICELRNQYSNLAYD